MQSFFWVFFSQYIYVNHVICNLGKCTSSWLKHACSNHERTWRQPVGFTIASRPTRSRYDESLALSLLNLIWCAFCVDFGVIYFFTCRRGRLWQPRSWRHARGIDAGENTSMVVSWAERQGDGSRPSTPPLGMGSGGQSTSPAHVRLLIHP